jgi:hypothetical protein
MPSLNITTSKTTDRCRDELPPCPVCSGLECLCRPRFFPGQLLSDEDLNRLQRYITGKNKLHNRYLHGYGVACGLEVVCDPCKTTNVVVRTGYALSPCGDDIVLCGDQSVNVCDLIAKCRAKDPICDPPYQSTPTQCAGGTEQWVLAVCYDETPSRGTTALTGAGDSSCGSGSCGCGCGGTGSASGGCSCGGKPAGVSKSAPTKTTKPKNPQCEPTQICEGYTFKLYKPAKVTSNLGKYVLPYGSRSALMSWMYGNRATLGPLLDRVLCCLLAAMDLRAQIREGRAPDGRTQLGVYGEYVDALREFARDFAVHECAALNRMNTVVSEAQTYISSMSARTPTLVEQAEIKQRLLTLDGSWMGFVAECFCSALLPACPDPATDNCVPLAVVTVEKRNCRVLEICNWQERKLLITWPTVMYWLSWLPWERLRTWIARLCCADTRSGASLLRMVEVLLGTAAFKTNATTGRVGQMEITPLMATRTTLHKVVPGAEEIATGQEPSPITFDRDFVDAMSSPSLMQYALDAFEKMAAGTDKTAPEWAALAARLVEGRALAPLAGNAAVAELNTKDLASQLGLTRLGAQVEELRKTVAEQQKVIDALHIVNNRKQ